MTAFDHVVLLLSFLAATIARRWAQWVSAIVFLALSVWWLITFNSSLK